MTSSVEAGVVGARRVRARGEALLDPGSGEWSRAQEVAIPLVPTPLDRQPSAYVQVAWADRPRGDIREVGVAALVNAGTLAVRLAWSAARPNRFISDVNVHPDACAVLFPANGSGFEYDSMGSPSRPVNGWHWRAGTEEPFAITATGIGTVARATEHDVKAAARWSDGVWQVVLARALAAEGVPLSHDMTVPVAFAIWSGAAGERAGLKSYSPRPHELRID
ncbi:MAG: hypothetical protein JJLCMIEE_01729 [Acidimicrobiales bacterium]|nr:MAG: hypothetical protein EDR02_05485 [Actinomycetota bacterium]MBV6508664.1 hypothetical protein [Acidimicrobiales bacterium]RIK08107.1 MAG: hypothetical protein DCC48_01605 [Acidobacteriota bacterium]